MRLLFQAPTLAAPAPRQPPPAPPSEPIAAAGREDAPFRGLHAAHEDYDKQLIEAALEEAGGNLSAASRILRITRNTLKSRMRQYGLGPGTHAEGEPEPGPPAGEPDSLQADPTIPQTGPD